MTVYIEYVIADNFAFTFVICALSYKILREKVRRIRCVLASALGTACAVVYPFIYNAALVVVFKIALSIAMCLILFLKQKKLLLHSAVFFISTAIIGGVQFMIGYMVHGNVYAALRFPISELPLSLFFVPPLIMYLIIRRAFASLNAHRLKSNYIYELKLTLAGKSKMMRGLVDTGNMVKDERDVVFINRVTALDILGGEYFKCLRGGSTLSVMTAAGSKKIVLLPGKIELYCGKDEHIIIDVQVGIGEIKSSGEYEALLPLSILVKE